MFSPTERKATPTLSIELSSNNPFNPFRNKSIPSPRPSPGLESPNSVQSAPGNRPVSRNPFLAAFENDNTQHKDNITQSGTLIDMADTRADSPKKTTFGANAEELFVS
jgi:hypothetical protein